MKIFFSWSGHLSKRVAKLLKPWLKDIIFPGITLEIFISEEDIEYGSEWYSKIKANIKHCDLAIIFLTPENMNASWLNFEAGAIAIGEENRPLITFLIDVPIEAIKSPLKQYQCFNISFESTRKLIENIRTIGKLTGPANEHIDPILDKHLPKLLQDIEKTKIELDRKYISAEISIFPEHITELKKNKIFIGSPMASVREETYEDIRKDVLELKAALINDCGFNDVYYPGEVIVGIDWDGQEKAILNDFKCLKESEHYIFVFPKKVTSSILMEMGYAIALSKNTLIFTHGRKSLPYMLQQADKAIPNIRIYEYREFSEVIKLVKANGKSLLTREGC